MTPEDTVQPSLADEMQREAARLDEERADAAEQQRAVLEERVSDRDTGEFDVAAAEKATEEGVGQVEAVIDLDHTQEEKAASVTLTEVSDISGGPKESLKITDFQEGQKKDCGLPSILMDRKRLLAYLHLHSVTGKMRRAMEYTATERNCYDRYQKLRGESDSVGKDHFTAALRMFVAGLPMSPTSEMNLNSMKVS